VDYVFDDYGEGYLFCEGCLVVARQYASARQSERIEEYPIETRSRCQVHLEEWCESVNQVSLDVLFERAVERTGELPER
jgi:DNA-binding transcriptional regulator YbjK